jgi:hypothetical protein
MMLGPQASSFLMNAPMWLAELVAVGASDVSSLTRHVYRDLREAMGLKETPDVSFLQVGVTILIKRMTVHAFSFLGSRRWRNRFKTMNIMVFINY